MNEREKVFEVKLVITAPECECDNEPTEEEIEELMSQARPKAYICNKMH